LQCILIPTQCVQRLKGIFGGFVVRQSAAVRFQLLVLMLCGLICCLGVGDTPGVVLRRCELEGGFVVLKLSDPLLYLLLALAQPLGLHIQIVVLLQLAFQLSELSFCLG
jgi:hypothetical protein